MIHAMELMMVQYFNFEPQSNLIGTVDKEWLKKIRIELALDEDIINYSARTNNSFNWLYAPKNGVIHFSFDDKLSFYNKIKEKYSSRSLLGVECLLLKKMDLMTS